MTIRKATSTDGMRCLEIYNAICDWETANGKQTCWNKDFYPTTDTVQNALARDDLYVLEDKGADGKDIIAACGIINHLQPDFYKKFSWKMQADESKIMVLHTFAVDPKLQGHGYGKFFMDFYEKQAHQRDCHFLRLDTTITNKRAQKMYKKFGFEVIGQVEEDPNGIGSMLIFLGLEKNISC